MKRKEENMKTPQQIIKEASETTDRPQTLDVAYSTPNDLMLRVAEQPRDVPALKEAQTILKGKLGIRHASDARQKGFQSREVLRGLLA